MATHAAIGSMNEDGSVTGITCHYDGYPSGAGATLGTYYDTPAQVDALLALGDLEILGQCVGERHQHYRQMGADQCTAFGRDRGQFGTEAVTFATASDWAEHAKYITDCRYGYLWAGGRWWTFHLAEMALLPPSAAVVAAVARTRRLAIGEAA